ncbi:MAG: EamA family transporter [Chloroflexi bacterium]|nr:EamA family transporter [Chloroflexota bacterium]
MVRLVHFSMLVVLSVIWGSAFMLVKVALEDVPPLTLVAGRVTTAFLFLGAILVISGRTLPRSRDAWFAFTFLAIVNNAFPFTLLTWGQQHIESALAAILVATMPLSTVVLAHVWINERLTLDRALGVLVGFGGVFLLIGGDLQDITGSSTLGQLAIIGGVVGYSTGTVFARRYMVNADPDVTAAGQTLVGSVIMIPIALTVETPFDLSVSVKAGLAWVALGVVASAIAYQIFFRLVRDISATQASMVSYLIPITAVLLGVLVLDESLEASRIAGLAVIIFGVWVVNGGGGWLIALLSRGDTALAAEPLSEPDAGLH